MQALRSRAAREWTEDDDALLDAILALRDAWRDREGKLTLRDFGIETRCVTYVISGLCPKHGQFVTEWTGRPVGRSEGPGIGGLFSNVNAN